MLVRCFRKADIESNSETDSQWPLLIKKTAAICVFTKKHLGHTIDFENELLIIIWYLIYLSSQKFPEMPTIPILRNHSVFQGQFQHYDFKCQISAK